ncbi:MAG: hypothetical protein ACXVP2_11480, partial [Tumebacillaceae bacterium]
AFQSGNVDKMISNVKDTRFKDADNKKAKYINYAKANHDRHSQLKLISVEKVDANDYKANLEISSDQYQPARISLPVVNENGLWKLLVDGSVVIKSPAK